MGTSNLSRISLLADAYSEALAAQKEAEANLKDAKEVAARLKEELVGAMVLEETDSIGRNGKKYSLVGKKKYSKRAGSEEELFSLLREQGLGDIITETVNANTLNAAMNALADEMGGALGEEWDGCINLYEYTDISVRKA
jgi:glycyl-tRNA synthetase beta subunit